MPARSRFTSASRCSRPRDVRSSSRSPEAVIRRTARGEPFFVADRGHIHHQLLRRGLSQRDAMLILTAISAALAVVAVLLARVG